MRGEVSRAGGVGPTVLYFPEAPATGVGPDTTVAGLAIANRLLRAARRAGAARIIAYAPQTAAAVHREADRLGMQARVVVVGTPFEWTAALATTHPDAPVAIVTAGVVVSPPLLRRAWTVARGSSRRDALRDVPAGDRWPRTGVYRTAPAAVGDVQVLMADIARLAAGIEALPPGTAIARGEATLVARAVDRSDLETVEHTVRRAMYKLSDAVLARFNRRISLPISVWLIRHTPLSPNALSLLLVGLALVVGWLFGVGTYWTSVAGAVVSLAASILDGCDGEIARLTHEETSTGCWIETLGDYFYYLALFAGMTAGVVRATGRQEYAWIGAAVLGGAVLTFVLLTDLRLNGTTGHPERLQVTARQRFTAGGPAWTRTVNELITVATRSTMPYGILVMTLLDALPLVLVLAAIGANAYWIAMLLRWRALGGGLTGQAAGPV